MINELDKQMMLKFLQRNYPVLRIKHNMRFKRTIITDDGSEYLISDPSQIPRLKHQLQQILKLVFDSDDLTNSAVLDNFLRQS